MIRELLGAGTLFGLQIIPEDYGMLMFILAPGAFVSLAYLIAIVNRIRKVS
jgi:electron transport complex protein RnfE